MNFRIVGRTVGRVLLLEALLMAPSLIWCAIDGEGDVAVSFLLSMGIILLVGLALILLGKRSKESFQTQEGFITVALCWIFMSMLGCLPFVISGQIPSYIDALFEIVSGFTTTGSSILTNVEAMSRGLLYWRSFSHWLGGMGILVFALAVVPNSKRTGGRLHLLRAESPGPSVDKLTPRVQHTAMILDSIYLGLTIICILFLLAGGMPLFDTLCTAFGTAGTGGFGIKNDSMASYSPYLQNVCTVFMLMFGVNFTIYYLLLMRQFRSAFRDEELRCYLLIFAVATAAITWDLMPRMDSLGESLHHAAFQVSSIMTTTGFASTDFNLWSPFSKMVLLMLMILGACAGSTGGGIKSIRLVLVVKDMARNLRRILRPNRVELVHINGKPVDDSVLRGVNAYFGAYWIILGLSLLIVSMDGFSVETNFSAVFSCFNNIGPGLDAVGPMSNFSGYSNLSKLVLTADMLLGRLEIFPIFALLSRHSWSRRS